MVVSAFALAKMVGNIPFAVLVERDGRKPYLVYSMIVISAGVGAIGLAGGFEQLYVCRLLTGLGVAGLSTAATMTATLHSSMDEAAFRRYNSSDYPSSGASGVPAISRSSQNGGGGSSSRRRSSGGSQGDDRGGERGSTRAGTSGSVASRPQPTSTAAPVLNRRSSTDDSRQWQLQRQLDRRNPPAVSSFAANGGDGPFPIHGGQSCPAKGCHP